MVLVPLWMVVIILFVAGVGVAGVPVLGGECPGRVVVVGGGYVGLHTAIMVARRLGEVLVVDIDPGVVERINSGGRLGIHVRDSYVLENLDLLGERVKATSDYGEARGADVYIVAVQTPERDGRIDYSPLESVARSLAKVVGRGALVVSETTIYPGGTLERLAQPLAGASGLELDADLFVAHAPERINPGSKRWPPERIPRVVGGVGPRSLEAAVGFYRDCLGLRVHPVEDIRVAEASKLLENSFRFLNIAYVNELKRVFDRAGIDFRRVVEAASTKPYGFMPFYPGPYIGGPCLPKDSRMMEEYSGSVLLRVARHVNEFQPLYYAALLLKRVRRLGARRILFLGVGYKPNAYTAVESPVLRVMENLGELDPGLELAVYDEYVEGYKDFDSVGEALEWADLVVRWGHEHVDVEGKPVVDLAKL